MERSRGNLSVLTPGQQHSEYRISVKSAAGQSKGINHWWVDKGPQPQKRKMQQVTKWGLSHFTEKTTYSLHVSGKVAQLCLTPCDPRDCCPPGSSVQGILQAGTLEWAAISSSRGSFRPRDRTCATCIGRWSRYCLSHREVRVYLYLLWIFLNRKKPDETESFEQSPF